MSYIDEGINTKQDLINKLNHYATTPDDDNIRIKEKIKDNLIQCPTLLYALNNKDLEAELFNLDGTINDEGDWSLYFGQNIKPFIFVPESTTETKVILCYTVGFREVPKYNSVEKYCQIKFVIWCDYNIWQEESTGLSRQDLIGSIIREQFNWSNIFGTQCKLVSDGENITDTRFISRTIIFEMTYPNSIINTPLNGNTNIINNIGR